MTYAGRAHLEQRFGVDEIADLAESGNHIDRVDRVLADASAEIDSRIGVAYSLPLPAGQYPLLLAIACDLARAELYDDTEHEAAQALAEQARDLLDKIVAGEAQLVDYGGRLVERRHRAAWRGPGRVFTGESLGGLAFDGVPDDAPPAAGGGGDAPAPSGGGTPSGGGQAPGGDILRIGWSADAVADASELTAAFPDQTGTIPDGTGALHLVVWRADAAGGDPAEVHIATGGNARNIFGPAAPLADANGTPGQVIVSVTTQKAGLYSGETLHVV